jgi:hypothetical protein
MPDDSLEPVRERLAEQIMSDERLLGVLPENAARLVLDHALARLDDAAARAASVEELEAEAAAIRADAWSVTEQASAAEDPERAVRALLAGEAVTEVAPVPEDLAAAPAGAEAEDVAAPAVEPAPVPDAGLEEAPPEPDVEIPAAAPPSLWARVRSIWRGLGRDG